MNRYRLLFSMILLLFLSPCLRAGEWQWSVTLDGFVSNETNRNPTAFLWIPADCMQIKAIIVGQHNMSEETLFDNPLFREKMHVSETFSIRYSTGSGAPLTFST